MLATARASSGASSASPSGRNNITAATRPNNPHLTPSERDNAAVSRRPRAKEVTSKRYLSSYSSSSSNTSTSYSSNTITCSSSSSSSGRLPSPRLNSRPSTPAAKRSQSADRSRPSAPRAVPCGGGAAAITGCSNAARALCTTTRSLSVSFQGDSFFYQTSKTKTASPGPARKPTPDRRRPSSTARNSSTCAADQSENSRPSEFHHRWPAARSRQSSLPTKALECSADNNDILATVRSLRQSMLLEDGTSRALFDRQEISASTDIDSLSSGSISGTPEPSVSRKIPVTSRVISVPSRSWQETNSRLRQPSEPGTPLSSSGFRNVATQKPTLGFKDSVRRSLVDSPSPSPRFTSSPLRVPVRPSSPSKLAGCPARGMSSPSRARGTNTLASSSPASMRTTAPSIISFAAEVRRSRKGENRIEEAHMLRLLHNRNLQWRCVNARTNTGMMVQRLDAEKNLHNAWIRTLELLDSVANKKAKLQLLSQYLKLGTVLRGQMVYLEDYSVLDREHSNSLSGAIEALKATTLRLPVVGGARADLQEVNAAVGSALGVMQAMGASIYSILSKI
ncbi:hypothetical protein KSP40_PGU014600 [Platanthera guangdongensis]|uniref:Uncharacterized protein n=1 Tax=Platanthera guangdongensis TaxID=2320717 RepID=A0ABR2MEG9_9ASPA